VHRTVYTSYALWTTMAVLVIILVLLLIISVIFILKLRFGQQFNSRQVWLQPSRLFIFTVNRDVSRQNFCTSAFLPCDSERRFRFRREKSLKNFLGSDLLVQL